MSESTPLSTSSSSGSGGGGTEERKRAFVTKKNFSGNELRAQGYAIAKNKQFDEHKDDISISEVTTPDANTLPKQQKLEAPVNYEALLVEKKKVLNKDPLKEILVFPDNSISVEILTREYRTVRSPCANQNLDKNSPRYIQKLFDIYTDDWVIVRRNLLSYSKYPRPYDIVDSEEGKNRIIPAAGEEKFLVIPDHKYEVDMKKSEQEQSTPLKSVFQDLDGFANEADARIDFFKNSKTDRNYEDTKNMIKFFQGSDDKLDSVEVRERIFGAPLKQTFDTRIMIECEALLMGESPEPFFGILALYDLKSKKRISENFHFDTNSKETLDLLKKHNQEEGDFASKSRQALFHISNAPTFTKDIYLVVRVEKVLEGDLDDTYSRAGNYKDKSKDAIADFTNRLGKFRQPYAWASIPIFDERGDLANSQKISIQPFYRYEDKPTNDEGIFAMIAAQKKPKTVPGSLECRLTVVESHEQPPNCFTPQLLAVKPFSSGTEKDIKLIKEIEEFPLSPIFEPFSDYVNHLYIYPISVNFQKEKAAAKGNIAVRIQFVPSSSSQSKMMKAIYGKSSSKNFLSEVYTAITFHNLKPDMYDEIKIALPVNLSKYNHILFTFYHVSCKPKKKADGETIIGYAWMPIFNNGKILKSERQSLPIFQQLDKNYDTPTANNKLLDSKTTFVIDTRVVSTVFTTDEKLNRVFTALQDIITNNDEDELIKALAELDSDKPLEVVRFSYLLFDELLAIYTRPTVSQVLGKSILRTIGKILQFYEENRIGEAREILTSYVNFRFSNPKGASKYVFEALLQSYYDMIASDEKSAEKELRNLLKYAWFIFDIAIKNIHQYLQTEHKWNGSMTPDPKWFKQSFLKIVESIVGECSQQVVRLGAPAVVACRELNESLAYFILDTSYFLEKSYIFTWVQLHITHLGYVDDRLDEFKFAFLKVICGFELYIPLNLPTYDIQEKPFLSLTNCLSEFSKRSYLSSVLLYEVQHYLDSQNKMHRSQAISLLRDVLLKHDSDPRYDTKEKKHRVIGLYFPFLLMVIARARYFEDNFYSREEKRCIFMCFLYILQNIDPKWIVDWLRKEVAENFHRFLDVLGYSLKAFEYIGKVESEKKEEKKGRSDSITASPSEIKRQFESMYGGGGVTSRNSITNSTVKTNSSTGRLFTAKTSNESLGYRNSLTSSTRGMPLPDSNLDLKLSGALAADTCLVILDIFETILLYQNPKSGDSEQSKKMFELLIRFLDQHQSEKVLLNLFGTIRNFILKFPSAIFKTGNGYCAEICRVVLRYANSTIVPVRQHVAALLYMLLKKNFEASNNTSCMKARIQITVSLSKLELQNVATLRKCLATVYMYAKEDASMKNTQLPDQTKDLVNVLFSISNDLIKMRDCQDDPDMVADMQYRIAKGYMNSPELRIAHLDALCRHNYPKYDFAEAAYCCIHIAALISQVVFLLRKSGQNPDLIATGASGFQFISKNLIVEDGTSIEGEGLSDAEVFTPGSAVKYLNKSLNLLKRALLFETYNDVCKLLIPYFEKQRDYEALENIHIELKECFSQIKEYNTNGKRILGTYYRVAFFGKQFSELDSQEFIYKEKKITPLADISNRMLDFYSKKFTPTKVELIHDSSDVNTSKLSPDVAYIQITHVEPYFTEEELVNRVTSFERANHINQFIFETPFTKGGKAHGSVADQYMRKTILTTEYYFPYIKRRIAVVVRKSIELNPLEVSIESIAKRSRALRQAFESKPVNAKNLQVVLQGSVRPQVNAGPIEIARIFLSPEKASEYKEVDLKNLKDQFVEFLTCCQIALIENERFVKADQRAYQDDLKEGFHELLQKLIVYLDTDLESRLRQSLPTPVANRDIFEAISGNSIEHL